MSFRHRLAAVGGVLLTTLALAAGVVQADSQTQTLTINAGSVFSETLSAITIPAITLTGQDQTDPYTLSLAVIDSRGSGAGWNLQLSQSPFSTGGTTPLYVTVDGKQASATNIATVTGTSAVCTTGSTCALSSNNVTYSGLTIPSGTAPTPVKVHNAALNTGMGAETDTVNVSLAIPGNTFAGTYTSTLTAAIVTGP